MTKKTTKKNKPAKAVKKVVKKTPVKPKKPIVAKKKTAKAPTKTPKASYSNYNKKNGVWYHNDGKKVTHKGTITFLENKKDFKPGVSGNPKGKPKGTKHRSTILAELLALSVKDKGNKTVPNPLNKSEKDITYEKLIMVSLIKKAAGGDVRAIQEIQNTMHGKITDKTEFTGKGGKDLPAINVRLNVVKPK